MAEFAYDPDKTQAWVREHWRQCILFARAGAGGGAIAMVEGFDEQIADLAGRMTPEDAVQFRAAVAVENALLNDLQARDTDALYARVGVDEAMLGDIDQQRRSRRGLEGKSGCVVWIGIVLAGAGLVAGTVL